MKKIFVVFLIAIFALNILPFKVFAAEEPIMQSTGISKKIQLKKDKNYDIRANKLNVVTKADFVISIHTILKIDIRYFAAPNIEAAFKDVKNSDLYADKLYDLVTLGIIDDKDYFYPNSELSKETAVHYLVRAYDYAAAQNLITRKSIPSSIYLPKNYRVIFNDLKSIDKLYLKDVIKAKHLNIIYKSSSKNFRPKNKLTKSESVLLLNAFKKLMIKEYSSASITITPDYLYTGDSLMLTADIYNSSKDTIVINFNSGHQYDFTLLNASKQVIYNWANDKMFTQALTSITLKPGDHKLFEVELPNVEKYIVENAAYFRVAIPGKLDDTAVIKPVTIELTKILKK